MSTLTPQDIMEELKRRGLSVDEAGAKSLQSVVKSAAVAERAAERSPRMSWVEANLPRERQLELELAYGTYVKKMIREQIRPFDPEGWLETQNIGPVQQVMSTLEQAQLRTKFAEATKSAHFDREPKKAAKKPRAKKPRATKAEKIQKTFTELMVEAGHGSVMERAVFLARQGQR